MNQKQEYLIHFLIILANLTIATQTDMYLPALPTMQKFFMAPEYKMHLITSVNFFGFCIGSLLFGPLTDSFGRKKIFTFGMIMFSIMTFFCFLTHDINLLLFFRFFQGFFGCTSFITTSAIIFDIFEEKKAAKILGLYNSITVFFIAFAPIIGSYINEYYNFHYIFLVIFCLAIFTLTVSLFILRETAPSLKKLNFKNSINDFIHILTDYKPLLNLFIMCLGFAGYMVFITNIPLIYVNNLGVPLEHFDRYQLVILLCYAVAAYISKYIYDNLSPKYVKFLCVTLCSFAVIGLALLQFVGYIHPTVINFFIIIYSIGFAISIGRFFADFISAHKDKRGVASSLSTACRLLFSSIIVSLSGALYNGTMTPVIIINGFVITIIIIFLLIIQKGRNA